MNNFCENCKHYELLTLGKVTEKYCTVATPSHGWLRNDGDIFSIYGLLTTFLDKNDREGDKFVFTRAEVLYYTKYFQHKNPFLCLRNTNKWIPKTCLYKMEREMMNE